jgi:hypothetical protein
MDVVALSSTGKTGRYPMDENDTGAEGAGEPAPMDLAYRGPESIDRKRTARFSPGDPGEQGGSHV